jgi:hypothetical protein
MPTYFLKLKVLEKEKWCSRKYGGSSFAVLWLSRLAYFFCYSGDLYFRSLPDDQTS